MAPKCNKSDSSLFFAYLVQPVHRQLNTNFEALSLSAITESINEAQLIWQKKIILILLPPHKSCKKSHSQKKDDFFSSIWLIARDYSQPPLRLVRTDSRFKLNIFYHTKQDLSLNLPFANLTGLIIIVIVLLCTVYLLVVSVRCPCSYSLAVTWYR